MLTGWPATGAGQGLQVVIQINAVKESNHGAAVNVMPSVA
jgi:hypothetical protein